MYYELRQNDKFLNRICEQCKIGNFSYLCEFVIFCRHEYKLFLVENLQNHITRNIHDFLQDFLEHENVDLEKVEKKHQGARAANGLSVEEWSF